MVIFRVYLEERAEYIGYFSFVSTPRKGEVIQIPHNGGRQGFWVTDVEYSGEEVSDELFAQLQVNPGLKFFHDNPSGGSISVSSRQPYEASKSCSCPLVPSA